MCCACSGGIRNETATQPSKFTPPSMFMDYFDVAQRQIESWRAIAKERLAELHQTQAMELASIESTTTSTMSDSPLTEQFASDNTSCQDLEGRFRQALTSVYEVFSPDKLPRLAVDIADRYHGEEDEVLPELQSRYGSNPKSKDLLAGVSDAVDALLQHRSELRRTFISNLTTSSGEFASHHWQAAPFFTNTSNAFAHVFTLPRDIRKLLKTIQWGTDNTFADPGIKTGAVQSFRMARQDQVRLPLVMSLPQIVERMETGTMLLSQANGLHKSLSDIVNAFRTAFGWPASINVYTTAPGFQTSMPLHTDRLDTFILQSSGRKHWQLFEPPTGKHLPVQVQLGKDWQVLPKAEVGKKLIDRILEPGDMLYFPRGTPHITSTPTLDDKGSSVRRKLTEREKKRQYSVALTVAVHSESLGFSWDKVIICFLGLANKLEFMQAVQQRTQKDDRLRLPIPLTRIDKEMQGLAPANAEETSSDKLVLKRMRSLLQLVDPQAFSDGVLKEKKVLRAMKQAMQLAQKGLDAIHKVQSEEWQPARHDSQRREQDKLGLPKFKDVCNVPNFNW